MAERISFTPVDSRTGEKITDPRKVAASQCLAVLVSCSRSINEIKKNALSPDTVMRSTETLGQLVIALLDASENGLEQNIETFASMVGCKLLLVAADRKADA